MRKLFHHCRLPLLFILLSAGGAQAHTQLSDSLKTEIRKISTIMYDSGNLHYVCADALCDGLIKLGESYEVNYDTNGVLTINESPVPYFAHRQYQEKLRRFLQKSPATSFSTRADSIKIDEIFDEHSSFRSYRGNRSIMPPDIKNYDIIKLVAMLQSDKLVDTALGYHVILSTEGLFINDQKMDDQQMQRYLHLLAYTDKTITANNIPYLEVIHKPDSDKK